MTMAQRTVEWTAWEIYSALRVGYCFPRLKRNWIRFELSIDESFQFGPILESNFYLLEHVFEFLDATDLHVACLVNDNWKSIATAVLQRRVYPTWICCTVLPRFCRTQTGTRFGWNSESCFILAYDSSRIRLSENICLHGSDMRNITFADYIDRELLANKRNYCVIQCRHISPANIANKTLKVLYQGLSIPSIPNIRTAVFHCSADNISPLANIVSRDEEVKCMLMITNGEPIRAVEKFITVIFRGKCKGMALGGGSVDSVTVSPTRHTLDNADRSKGVRCIGFIQKKANPANFNAYSTVMHLSTHSNLVKFERHILMLKKNSILRKHGVVFVFCSVSNIDITIKLIILENKFPNYVVLQIKTNTEIGSNTNNMENIFKDQTPEFTASIPSNRKLHLQRCHVWSTAIVLITWGNIQR